MRRATSRTTILADDRGFTLLEMLLALVIVSLATLAVGVAASGLKERSVFAGTMRSIDEMLASARRQAVTEGQMSYVTFDVASRRFRWSGGDWKELSASIEITITAASSHTGTDARFIVFFSDGSSSGGHLEVTSGNHTMHRRISWLTGSIRNEG